jgi:hypothetical protein
MIKSSTRSITALYADPRVRLLSLVVYYLAVMGGVLILGTLNAFTTPTFVYQGF